MKTLLLIFISLLLMMSCQQANRFQASDGNNNGEESIDTTPQATAIFWVDKVKNNLTQKVDNPTSASTAKAKVDIDSTGKIKVLSYVKPQSEKVINYLHHRLSIFRVTKIMLDSGHVKPGIQYVQLRYVPERMQTYR